MTVEKQISDDAAAGIDAEPFQLKIEACRASAWGGWVAAGGAWGASSVVADV